MKAWGRVLGGKGWGWEKCEVRVSECGESKGSSWRGAGRIYRELRLRLI